MEESILVSIKKLLGIHEDDDSFDTDIIIHINSALMVLYQLGVGTVPFIITGDSEEWSDYLNQRTDLQGIKTYIYLKVKMMFDPPSSSIIAGAMNEAIDEFEWRINTAVDPSSTNS